MTLLVLQSLGLLWIGPNSITVAILDYFVLIMNLSEALTLKDPRQLEVLLDPRNPKEDHVQMRIAKVLELENSDVEDLKPRRRAKKLMK